MDPKTAKKEIIIIVILFIVGFIFNFYAPEKFKLDFSDLQRLGKSFSFIGKILAPISMGLFISGFYCAWKILGLLWQRLMQKSTNQWFVSPVLIIIGLFAKLIIAAQFAALIGLPILIYSIYCLRKLKQGL